MLLFCFHHHYYHYYDCCCYFYSFVVAFYLFNVYILHHTYHQCIENYFSVYFLNFFFFAFGLRSSAFLWHYFLREQEKPEKNKTMHKNAIVCCFFTLGSCLTLFFSTLTREFTTHKIFIPPFLLFAISMCTGQ